MGTFIIALRIMSLVMISSPLALAQAPTVVSGGVLQTQIGGAISTAPATGGGLLAYPGQTSPQYSSANTPDKNVDQAISTIASSLSMVSGAVSWFSWVTSGAIALLTIASVVIQALGARSLKHIKDGTKERVNLARDKLKSELDKSRDDLRSNIELLLKTARESVIANKDVDHRFEELERKLVINVNRLESSVVDRATNRLCFGQDGIGNRLLDYMSLVEDCRGDIVNGIVARDGGKGQFRDAYAKATN